MNSVGSAAGCVCLLLLTACGRDLYLGHDTPPPAGTSEIAGQPAPPEPAEPQPTAPLVAARAEPTAPTADEKPMTQEPAPQAPMSTTQAAAPPVCGAGQADCDGEAGNGCEADLMRDRNHCGTCNNACQTADCDCEDGQLELTCQAGRADCDGEVGNGCEVDLTNDMEHCGACERRCHTQGHDVTNAMCVAGKCEISCEPRISPEADCDGDPDNGCETYLMFDRENCGECGNTCLTNCEGGRCMI